jgi:hypothetical protein
MMFEAADERLSRAVIVQTKRLTDGVAIAFECAILCFFVVTVFCVWLFFGTTNWVRARGNITRSEHVSQPPDTDVWNDNFILTSAKQLRLRCTDPYDQAANDEADRQGSIIACAYLIASSSLVAVYVGVRMFVTSRYKEAALERLAVSLLAERREREARRTTPPLIPRPEERSSAM